MGSTSELDYRLLLARDLKLINPKDYGELAQRTREVKRLLGGLLGKLKAERSTRPRFQVSLAISRLGCYCRRCPEPEPSETLRDSGVDVYADRSL